MPGSPLPISIATKQARIAMMARTIEAPLHNLAHNMDLAWMVEAVARTRKDSAPGVDGVTADDFAAGMPANLETMLDLILSKGQAGRYRADPVRRVEIPKGDGTTRPIGIPTYSDKVAQRGVHMLLEPVYEEMFYDFSYGFRPGRGAHQALEALNKILYEMRGGWVLDADVSKFFDTLDHAQLQDILRQRVTDRVIVRMVGKWLHAGVLDGGVVHRAEHGTPQGGVISPLLANIYMHTVLDTWWVEEVLPRMRGRAHLIRYADDFVMVFSDRDDAVRVHEVLPKRFAKFGLTMHPEKTRLLPFRSPDDPAAPPPGSFDFLGFTHRWGRSQRGYWTQKRETSHKRLTRAAKAVRDLVKQNRHRLIDAQVEALRRVMNGHFEYYGIELNAVGIGAFAYIARVAWFRELNRRSQRRSLDWAGFNRLLKRYPLPPARIRHRFQQLQLQFGGEAV